MQRSYWAAALLAGWLASGCFTPQQVRKMESDNTATRAQVDSLRLEVERLRRALAKAELPALQAKESALRATADVEWRMNQFGEQVRILTDRVDDLDHRVTNLPNKLQLAADKIAATPAPVSTSPSSAEPVSKDPSARSEPAPEKAATVPAARAGGGEMSKLYDAAYQDLVRGQFELAREGFAEFLRRYPNSTLADNAQYWIGESFYSQQQYSRAAAEFAEVMEKHPNGDKVPAAMLKRAFAMISMSKRSEARVLLEQLIKKYPNTQEAELARARLKDL